MILSDSISQERKNLRNQLINLVKQDHEKELFCHIQFVAAIGLELAQKYNADELVVEVSCFLHDIGRGKEKEGEHHSETGARIVKPLLETFPLTEKQKQLILQCIRNHQGNEEPSSIEEKILITADGASKVIYHEAFMLLCKKQTYDGRAKWGLKYLEKGMKNTILKTDVNFPVDEKYHTVKEMYLSIITSHTEYTNK